MDIGCACACDSDGDMAKISRTTYPRARKEHSCCECGAIIKVGEEYECVSGLWESWYTFKTCETCRRIRTDVCCGTFDFGMLREVIWEVFGIDYVTGAIYGDDD